VVVLALALALAERRAPRDPWVRTPVFLANLGYAVPGTVLAVATMLLLVDVDRHLGVALSSSAFAIVAALTLRFLRVGFGAVDAGLHGVRGELIDSARVLGVPAGARLRRIVIPLLRPSLLAALLLVGVEAMKEMPATLMLRPFGWDTLAVKIYGYTSEGLWKEAAWPALLLVAAGLLPVRWLVRVR
jgi:iron(III) transport system permease protein